MRKKLMLGLAVLGCIFFASNVALADNAQRCLQLYYMKSYDDALSFCLQAAEEGNDQAQYVLGLMYADGQGTKKDHQQAARWFSAAAGQGYAAAKYKLQTLETDDSSAIMQRLMAKHQSQQSDRTKQDKPAVMPDPKQSDQLILEPKPESMQQTAVEQQFVLKDTQLKPSKKKISDAGTDRNPMAQAWADDMAKLAVSSTDSLFQQHLLLAQNGSAEDSLIVGLMYYEGRDIEQDDVQAAHWLGLAAEQGLAAAQLSLALLLYQGSGADKDKVLAMDWFSRAAEQGLAEAQFSLGLIYKAEKNNAQAVQWWQRAAQQQHAQAQHNLAVMYLKGLGVQADRDEAMRWLHQEAEHGHPQAQFNLGRLYSEGKWLDKNGAKAAKWYYRAGEAYLARGQKKEVIKSAEKIKQLSSQYHLTVPNDFLADVLLKQLQETH